MHTQKSHVKLKYLNKASVSIGDYQLSADSNTILHLYQGSVPHTKCFGTRSVLDIGLFGFWSFQVLEYMHTSNKIKMDPKSKQEIHLCFIYILYTQSEITFIHYF